MKNIDMKELDLAVAMKLKIELLEAKNQLLRDALMAIIEHGESAMKKHPEQDGISYPVAMIEQLKGIYESSK